jgi:1,4-alpha-glucan branching enzyme
MKKTPTTNGKTRVTFEVPVEAGCSSGSVRGDFNDWTPATHIFKARKDGSLSVTVYLDPGRYQFRYLLDEGTWENDWAADGYEPNPYGGHNSVVEIADHA